MAWDWDFLIFRDIQKRLLIILNYQFETIVFLKIVFITLIIFLTGYLFTRFLMRKGLKLNFLEIIGTSYLLGFGIVPFIPLILSSLFIELRWLYLFIPILIMDVVLLLITFPENIGLNVLRSMLFDFFKKLLNEKDILFFFIVIYSFIFSLVMIPVFLGSNLGIKGDAGIYAALADFILQGNSIFCNARVFIPFFNEYYVLTPYTIFYLLFLITMAVLTNVGDVYKVSYLFGPVFSISVLPLSAYVLLDKFTKNKRIIKLGIFLLVFASEEIIFWSLFGKGLIVAISYIILSLNFFVRLLRRIENTKHIIHDSEAKFELLLSGFFAGIAFLYHASAFVFILMIAFFLIIEFIFFRYEMKEILRPIGIFLSISCAFTLIWIPSLFAERPLDWKNPSTWRVHLFVEAHPLQRLLYPFLFHYIPARQFPPPLPFAYMLFGFGTGLLFGFTLISIILDRSLLQTIEKRLVSLCFIFAYLFPLHPFLTGSAFYFIPSRFVIYLEVVSALLVVISLSNNQYFMKYVKRYPFIFAVIWFAVLILTFRWYVHALWTNPVG